LIKQKTHFTNEEKMVLIIFSTLLLTGAMLLHTRQHRVRDIKVTVTNNGSREELTLAETERLIKEQEKVYINTAAFNKLTTIPGIGETLAMRIIRYREEHGRFWIATDLLNINGIGEEKLKKIKPFIKIE